MEPPASTLPLAALESNYALVRTLPTSHSQEEIELMCRDFIKAYFVVLTLFFKGPHLEKMKIMWQILPSLNADVSRLYITEMFTLSNVDLSHLPPIAAQRLSTALLQGKTRIEWFKLAKQTLHTIQRQTKDPVEKHSATVAASWLASSSEYLETNTPFFHTERALSAIKWTNR